MRSDRPQAKEAKTFQEWVTRAVLPAIRKDGAYVMGEEKVATGELFEDELVMRAMSIMSRKVLRLTQDRHILAREERTGQLPTPWMLELEHQLRPRWTAVMLTHALSLPMTSAAVGANVDRPEILWCATPNTSMLHIFHGSFPFGSPWQESRKCVPAIR